MLPSKRTSEFPNFSCPRHPDEYYKYICLDLDVSQRLYCSDCIALSNLNLNGKLEKISNFFERESKVSQELKSFGKEKEEFFKRFCSFINLEEFILMKNIENHQIQVNKIFDDWMQRIKEYYKKLRENFKSKINQAEISISASKLPQQISNKMLYLTEKDYIRVIEEMINNRSSYSEQSSSFYEEIQNCLNQSDPQFSTKVESVFDNLMHNISDTYQKFIASPEFSNLIFTNPRHEEVNKKSFITTHSKNVLSGIKENLHLSELLEQGWKIVYRVPYSHPTNIEELQNILSRTNSNTRICVTATHKDQEDILPVAGFGYSEQVLQETHSTKDAKDNNEGCNWYLVKNFSFGFSESTSINLSHADINTSGLRISWHLNGTGGYRVNDHFFLDKSEDWEKLILILN